jgi:formylglycine-generating enzyme required for sulfatase activity/serine/threonine protein kinase
VVPGESEQNLTIEGSVLNYRYQIERVLNDKGGMGLIYLATDLNLRGTVVLKKSRFVDEQSRSAFEREARLLYGLRHNALPRVIDYFIAEDQSQYFVMEFIPGKDLSELLSMRIERGEGPFPMEQVLEWGEQLLDALHYLHTHEPPIIHRDIKPQNLKLMPNGQVILLDFGLAKGSVGGMTMGVSIQGYTPNYAPLEQMRGSGTDARSDIYSLAVTMHCLLSGQMPPDAVSRAIETLSAQPDPLRSVHEINLNIPALVSEALQKACSLNQNERPQTAAVMRDMIRRARASLLSGKNGASQKAVETATAPSVKPASSPAPVVKKAAPTSAQTPSSEKKAKSPAAVVSATPAVGANTSSRPVAIAQATQPNEDAPVVKAEAIPASPTNGKPAAEKQFVMAFAPVRAGDAKPVAEGMQKNGTPRPVIEKASEKDGAKKVEASAVNKAEPASKAAVVVTSQADPEEIKREDARVAQQAHAISVVETAQPAEIAEEAVAAAKEEEPAQPPLVATPGAPDIRPTSIVVIEHRDDGKLAVNGEGNGNEHGQHPVVTPPAPAMVIVSAPAPVAPQILKETPAAPVQPAAERRVVAPVPPAARSFDSDSLRRARQAAENLDKPRPVIVNQRKEKPEEYLLPNPDAEPSVKPVSPPAVSGLRSFTEVIGFGVRLEMHAIPGGDFLMGSPEKRGYADEFPQHKVAISPFYIGRYPVTQKQYRAVMRTNPSSYLEDSHPVETVTWDEAVEFCRRLTIATGRIYRLPTEAEWEYACRAGSTTLYCFGDDEDTLNQYGWNLTNSGNHTHPVGEKKPNNWGLCDTHGNVWEWCLDWYDQMYYLQSPTANPNGPTKGISRVLRGGSRYSLPNYCRSATRSNHQPDQRDALVGFRVVCEARELPT